MADVLRDWLIAKFPGQKSESPMESLLFAGWEMMQHNFMFTDDAGLKLTQQADVGSYRADFRFQIKQEDGGKIQFLIVEVDGHDFHERTKAQAAHDKARDRWMTANGYALMRFTGSEVWANPFQCAQDIVDRLYLIRYGRSKREAIARAGFEAIRKLIERRT